jgi:hypothetical protein
MLNSFGSGAPQRPGMRGLRFTAALDPGRLDGGRLVVPGSRLWERPSAELAQGTGLHLGCLSDGRVDVFVGPGN